MSKTKQTSFRDNDIISASEIGQYIYCSISWYLHRCGYMPKSPLLDEGKNAHIALGETIDSIKRDIKRSRCLAFFGYLFLIISILIFLLWVIL